MSNATLAKKINNIERRLKMIETGLTVDSRPARISGQRALAGLHGLWAHRRQSPAALRRARRKLWKGSSLIRIS